VEAIVRVIDGAEIGQRRADGYINATQLCKAAGKKWADYRRLDSTADFIRTLAESTGIPVDSIVEQKSGREGGTWVHPRIAINLAQWCSARFAAQVSQWVEELLTSGRVELARPSSGDPIIDRLVATRQCVDALIETRRIQIEMGERIEETWNQVGVLTAHVGEVEAKADAAMKRAESNYGHYSVLAYYNLRGREVSVGRASAHGKRLTAICRTQGLPVHVLRDPRFGEVNTYPESVLKSYFDEVWGAGGE
jgi:KilA-N domain